MSAAAQPALECHRFTRRNPCPWCGHDSPCVWFDDGRELCHREGDPANWTESYLGGYWHHPDRGRPGPPRRAARPAAKAAAPSRTARPTPTAPSAAEEVDTRHAVYSALWDLLSLSEAHEAVLRGPEHGLSRLQARRYRTLPGGAAQRPIVDALLQRFGRETLLAVPGFIERDGQISIAGQGIILPVRDLAGRIVAVDVRRAAPKRNEPRYYKLSSARAGGPGPGTPAHLALPAGFDLDDWRARGGVVYITEGIKKADVAADALLLPVISIAGISTHAQARSLLEALAGDVLVLALDRDDPAKKGGRTVEDVERARAALATLGRQLNYAVRDAVWDWQAAKGIDDVLIAGVAVTRERYNITYLDAAPLDEDAQLVAERVAPLEALQAMPHDELARLCQKTMYYRRAADDYLNLISRLAGHQAEITPADDPSAKRRRLLVSAQDRVNGTNDILHIRAASRGGVPTRPVAINRGQIAAASRCTKGAVSTSRKVLAAIGFFHVEAVDHEASRITLPAVMPTVTAPSNVIDLLASESARRRKARLRKCENCGSTNLIEETTTRLICLDCAAIEQMKPLMRYANPSSNADAGGNASGERAQTEATPSTDAQGGGDSITPCKAVTCEADCSSPSTTTQGVILSPPLRERLHKRERHARLDRQAQRRHKGHEDWHVLPLAEGDGAPAPHDVTPAVPVPADAWNARNTGSVPPPPDPTRPTHPCPACHTDAWWLRPSLVPDRPGAWLCGRCHPRGASPPP